MLRNDGSEHKFGEMEKFLIPNLVFMVFPALLSFLGALILTQLFGLIGAYNYLRGSSSPIDQSALVLLGSDLTRIVIFSSCIIGMVIGLYLSRSVTTKLDVVKKEGETEISVRMFLALLFSWEFFILPILAIWVLDRVVYGFHTSNFLSNLSYFTLSGLIVAFSIPVLLKYGLLFLHTRSIDSRVTLIEHRSGNGFIKVKNYTLKVIRNGPDP